MGAHPLNLTLRFLLEVVALVGIGYWGWTQGEGFVRILLAFGLPGIASALWVTFAVPNDPSRSGYAPVPVPGIVRLLLEVSIFGLGTYLWYAADQPTIALLMLIALIIHHIASYDRLAWLLQQ